MFLLEGATRDPRVAAAALSIQADISAVTAADVQRLARQYLTPARQWSLAILPKGMTRAEASTLDAAPPSAVVGGRSVASPSGACRSVRLQNGGASGRESGCQ